MDANRLVYLILFIIYIIFIIIALWALLSYTNVSSYVLYMLILGLSIILIGVFIKEYVYIDYDYYIWIYIALNVVGLILIAAGFVYAIMNSNLNWFVWGAIALALILSIIGNVLSATYPNDFTASCVVSIIAFLIFAIALILVLGYGPWAINLDLTLNNIFWFFPFLGLTVIVGILSVIFEGLSLPICCPCKPSNPCGQCDICKPVDPCEQISSCEPINSCQPSNPCGQCDICKPINSCQPSNPCGQCDICKQINSCHPSNPCGHCNKCTVYHPVDSNIQIHNHCSLSNPCGQCNICRPPNQIQQLDQNKSTSLCKLIDICKSVNI